MAEMTALESAAHMRKLEVGIVSPTEDNVPAINDQASRPERRMGMGSNP